jgi:RNA polymerase sigma-70 factor (ECF subfamily)
VLCDRHSGELLNVVARIFGPDFAGTPFVITTLQRSLECLDELSEPRAFRLWLLMRLVNAARWKLRLHAIRRWFRRQSHAAPTRRLPYSERLAATYALLDRLSVEQRLAFCLVIIQSMTLSEAAAILGTASGVLEKRLTRAHSRFTRLAQQYCPALLQTHRSHASLGVQIASEQDQLPGDSQLYEWDLARDRKPLCSA